MWKKCSHSTLTKEYLFDRVLSSEGFMPKRCFEDLVALEVRRLLERFGCSSLGDDSVLGLVRDDSHEPLTSVGHKGLVDAVSFELHAIAFGSYAFDRYGHSHRKALVFTVDSVQHFEGHFFLGHVGTP